MLLVSATQIIIVKVEVDLSFEITERWISRDLSTSKVSSFSILTKAISTPQVYTIKDDIRPVYSGDPTTQSSPKKSNSQNDVHPSVADVWEGWHGCYVDNF